MSPLAPLPDLASDASRCDRMCNWISWGGLAAILLFAATWMPVVESTPGRTKVIWLLALFLTPWLPQLPRRRFWSALWPGRWRKPDLFLAAFLVLTGISALLSVDRAVSAKWFAGFLLTCVGPYALARLTLDKPCKVVVLGAVGCLLLFGMGAFWLWTFVRTGLPLYGIGPPLQDLWRGRTTLQYPNPIPASHAWLLLAGWVGVLAWSRRSWRWFAILPLLAVAFFLLFAAKSRGALLAAVVASVGLLLWWRWRVALGVLLCAGILAAATYSDWPPRIRTTVSDPLADQNIATRIENHFLAAEILSEAPVFGVGPRSLAFAASSSRPRSGVMQHYVRDYTPHTLHEAERIRQYRFSVSYTRTLDNTLLTLAAEHGTCAALAFFAFLAVPIAGVLRGRPKGETDSRSRHPCSFFTALEGLRVSLAFSLFAYFVAALNHDAHVWQSVSAQFGIAMGTLVTLGEEKEGRGAGEG